jgi:hypothetical protein
VDKKGFLFTVTLFLVLMYILLTISVWVKGVETSERAFSEFYKESTVELAIEQITPAKMDNVTYMIMNRALSRLNENAINHPVVDGTATETENIENALFELLMDGSADSAYFIGTGGQIVQEENSSLNAWASNMNASLLAIGVYMSDFEVSNFEVGQGSYNTVNYSFDINLQIRDFTNTSSVSRTYNIENEINITGLLDPALARATDNTAADTAYRLFFFHEDYQSPSDISVDPLSASVQGGQGFLYGPLAMANGTADDVQTATDIAPSKRKNYILVGNMDDIVYLGAEIYNEFGGYILTNAPTTTSTACGTVSNNMFNPVQYDGAPPDCEARFGTPRTAKPFIVAPGFSASTAPRCPILDGMNRTGRCVLFVNDYLPSQVGNNPPLVLSASGADIYDVEIARDFIMCGYYTHSPKAPSYLQRLLNSSYSRNSTLYGIETFVIGNYVNDYSVYDMNGRLDRELLNGSIEGIKIRGLPGCKNYASCADSPVTGIFAVSQDTVIDYGLDEIACDNGAAGCDE